MRKKSFQTRKHLINDRRNYQKAATPMTRARNKNEKKKEEKKSEKKEKSIHTTAHDKICGRYIQTAVLLLLYEISTDFTGFYHIFISCWCVLCWIIGDSPSPDFWFNNRAIHRRCVIFCVLFGYLINKQKWHVTEKTEYGLKCVLLLLLKAVEWVSQSYSAGNLVILEEFQLMYASESLNVIETVFFCVVSRSIYIRERIIVCWRFLCVFQSCNENTQSARLVADQLNWIQLALLSSFSCHFFLLCASPLLSGWRGH